MNSDKCSSKNILILIFLTALLIRMIFGIFYFQVYGSEKFVDDWDYISYAKNILNQGIFIPDISKLYSNSHLVGPGLPLIVATMFAIFGKHYLPIIVLNAIMSSLICVLLFYIGKELFNEKVGLFSAGWCIIYVLFIWYIPTILKEVWIAFLFPLVIYFFILETKGDKISIKSFSLIILFVFLIHMDERFFAYFPLLFISFLLLDAINWKNGLRKAILFFSLVIILMIPWLIRNYNVYKRPVILTERTARFTDKIFGFSAEEAYYIKKEKKYSKFIWDEVLVDSILLGKEISGLKGKRYRRLQSGLRYGLIPHRYTAIEMWWAEFKELWRPLRFSGGYVSTGFRFEGPWSARHNIAVGITYGLLLPFFLLGSALIIKNKDKKNIIIISIILLHTFIHVFLIGVRNRYRIPIDAFVITIAFYGLTQMHPTIMKKTRHFIN